jgi:hypothetical protein
VGASAAAKLEERRPKNETTPDKEAKRGRQSAAPDVVAIAAASGAGGRPVSPPTPPPPDPRALQEAVEGRFDARFGAPPSPIDSIPEDGTGSPAFRGATAGFTFSGEAAGIAAMKTRLESVKKKYVDSGSEYNEVIRGLDALINLWSGVSDQTAFAGARDSLASAYDSLTAACKRYLDTHTGYRFSAVGRHRKQVIGEIGKAAAEKKTAVEAAVITAPKAPAPAVDAQWRQRYLALGPAEGSKGKDGWPLGKFADTVRTCMGDSFRTLGDDQFVREANQYNTRLNDLREKCYNYISDKKTVSPNPIFKSDEFMKTLKEEFFWEIAESRDTVKNIVTGQGPAASESATAEGLFATTYVLVMSRHANEMQTFSARRAELLQDSLAGRDDIVDKSQTILGYLLDTKLEDEKFSDLAKRAQFNAKENIAAAAHAFDARFKSPIARAKALGQYMAKAGGSILSSSTEATALNASDMAAFAHVKAADAAKAEAEFLKQMKETGFKESWLPVLYMEVDKLTRKGTAAEALDLRDIMSGLTGKGGKKENGEDAGAGKTADERAKELDKRVEKLRRAPGNRQGDVIDPVKEFCGWYKFLGQLRGYESAVEKAVDAHFKSGGLTSPDVEYGGGKIEKMRDVARVEPSVKRSFFNILSRNILINLDDWASIGDEKIKRDMISELIIGPSPEAFLAATASKRARAEARAREDELRFSASLMVPAEEEREMSQRSMFYDYLGGERDKTKGKERSERESRRINRLSGSSLLNDKDYETLRANYLYAKESDSVPAAGKDEKDRREKEKKRRGKETQEIVDKIRDIQKGKKYEDDERSSLNDLLMGKYALAAFEAGGSLASAFSTKSSKDYNKELDSAVYRILSRETALDDILSGASELSKDRKALLRANMRRMIAGLLPISESDDLHDEKVNARVKPEPALSGGDPTAAKNVESNKARFGVASWKYAVQGLLDFIDNDKKASSTDQAERDSAGAQYKDAAAAAENMKNRLKYLGERTYGGRIFALAMPLIRSNPVSSRILMFGSESEFFAMEKRLETPLKLIAVKFSLTELIARQLIYRHFDDMVGETAFSEKEWDEKLLKSHRELSAMGSEKSVDAVYNKLLERKTMLTRERKNTNVMRFFSAIVEDFEKRSGSGGDFSKLGEKKALHDYRERYKANARLLDAFWADKSGVLKEGDSAKEADRQSFIQFVGKYMVLMEPAGESKASGAPSPALADDEQLKDFQTKGVGSEGVRFNNDFLSYMFDAYMRRRSESLKSVAETKQVMNARRFQVGMLQAGMAYGEESATAGGGALSLIREKRISGVSPMMSGLLERQSARAGAPGGDGKQPKGGGELRDAMKKKAAEKTRKGLEEKVQQSGGEKLSEFVRNSLLERRIAGEDEKDKESQAAADALTRLERVFNERIGKNLPPRVAADFLPYAQVFGVEWKKPHPIDKNIATELTALLDDYDAALAAAAELANIDITGSTLAMERDEALRDVRYAVYVLRPREFFELVAPQTQYFKNAALCEQAFAEAAGGSERLVLALRTYLDAALRSPSFDAGDVSARAKELLKDKTSRDLFLAAAEKDALPGRLDAVSAAAESVGSDDLADYELTGRGMADRLNFEELIMNSGRALDTVTASYWQKFNKFDLDARRVFAISLTMPDQQRRASMPNDALAGGAYDRKALTLRANLAISAYVEGKEFEPRINYDLAILTLTTRNGELRGDVFDEAYKFTQLCVMQRAENTGKRSHLLYDPSATLEYSVLKKTELNKLRDTKISAWDGFVTSLEGTAAKDVNRLGAFTLTNPMEITKKVKALKGKEPQLLIAALQDRTMLDYTVRVSMLDRSGGTVTPFVNESGRGELADSFAGDTAVSALDDGELTNAYLALHSYQVKDDVDLSRASQVRESELADGAKSRATAVDWALLERALDFVKDANKERARRAALENLLPYEDNAESKREFENFRSGTFNGEMLFGMLRSYAIKEEKLPELAGYLSLNDDERTLFVKALGRRATLDISKRNIMLNRFGITDRDYADSVGRDALAEEFFRSGRVAVESDDYQKALSACFSAQIDDSADLSDPKNAVASDSSRSTVMDWKLISRALQFVTRMRDEREAYMEDRQQYLSFGDVASGGEFKYSAGNQRRNIHSAGNRFTHFFGRRAAENAKDKIPGPAMRVARALMPVDWNNKLSGFDILAPEEKDDSGVLKKAVKAAPDIVEGAAGAASGAIEQLSGLDELPGGLSESAPSILSGTVEALAGHVTDKLSPLRDLAQGGGGELISDVSEKLQKGVVAYKALCAAYDIYKTRKTISEGNEKAAKAAERDEERRAAIKGEEGLRLELELRRREHSLTRNARNVDRGKSMASSRKTDKAVSAVSELIGGIVGEAVGEAVPGVNFELIIKEAGEFINFIRNYFEDKNTVANYFEPSSESARIKSLLRDKLGGEPAALTQLEGLDKTGDTEMTRRARGYENMTEMASIAGLGITRSILFSAGPQNGSTETRVHAIVVLTLLGCEKLRGKQDKASAEKLYGAIMGGAYR